MLDHVSISVSDMARAERFYDAVMAALDVMKVGSSETWIGYGERSDATHPDRAYLSIRLGPRPERAPGRHWCFKATNRQAVEAFWRAGLEAGGRDEGAPSLREAYLPATTPRSYRTRTGTGLRPSATRRKVVDWRGPAPFDADPQQALEVQGEEYKQA